MIDGTAGGGNGCGRVHEFSALALDLSVSVGLSVLNVLLHSLVLFRRYK